MLHYSLVRKICCLVGITFPATFVIVKYGDFQFFNTEKINDISEAIKPGLSLNKNECVYKAKFCNENIYDLAKKIQTTRPEELQYCYVVFILNEYPHAVFLWNQVDADYPGGLNLWDFHAVLVYSRDSTSWVYDLDSALAFPERFGVYCGQTFGKIPIPFQRLVFRVMSAEAYLKHYPSCGEELEPYLCRENGKYDVEQYGRIFDLKEFIAKFSK